MKKYYKFLFFISLFFFINNVKAYTYADALKEVTNAYINKSKTQSGNNGGLIQYDSYLKEFNISPEDAVEDKIRYLVCSSYIYQIYKETFNVSLPYTTAKLSDYAHKNINDTNSIKISERNYNSNDIQNSGLKETEKYVNMPIDTDSQKLEFKRSFTNDFGINKSFKVGDIVLFRWYDVNEDTLSGHTLMVYSVDENGLPKEFTESYTVPKSNTNKRTITRAINPLEKSGNKITDFVKRSKNFFVNNNKTNNRYLTEITVIRLLENNGNQDIKTPLNVKNKFLNGKTVTDSTRSRLAHQGLVISKKSSGHNGRVNPGETITYELTFTNTSTKEIKLPRVTEEIDISKVDYINNNAWEVLSTKNNMTTIKKEGIVISPTKSVTINYKVKVKSNDVVKLNDHIYSNGHVGNIRNATLDDIVGYKLDNNTKAVFKEAITSTNNSSKGIGYINKIYTSFYKKMGIDTNTVLYTGIGASNFKLFGISEIDNKKVFTGLLDNKNNYLDSFYTKALDYNSRTKYHSVYPYYHKSINTVAPSDKISLDDSNSWYQLTKKFEEKTKYPLEQNLSDGDVILLTDYENKIFKEYAFLYFDGKLYSSFDANIEKFYYHSSTIKEEMNNIPQFLADLETFYAYAVFSPLQNYAIEKGLITADTKPEENYNNICYSESYVSKEKQSDSGDEQSDLVYEENSICETTNTEENESITPSNTKKVTIKGDTIYCSFDNSLKVSKLLDKIIIVSNNAKIYNKNNIVINNKNDVITTNSIIKLSNKNYKIVILGDVDSDGKKTMSDLYIMFKHIKKKDKLTDTKFDAADYDKDNKVTMSDLYSVFKIIKGN